jgi:hypothetical protein
VKKKPEIQNVSGAPLSIHFYIKLILSRKSTIQEARGLSDG